MSSDMNTTKKVITKVKDVQARSWMFTTYDGWLPPETDKVKYTYLKGKWCPDAKAYCVVGVVKFDRSVRAGSVKRRLKMVNCKLEVVRDNNKQYSK